MGRSGPQPGRSIADCAGDVRAICAALEIDRLAMWGWSGGGAMRWPAWLDLVAAAASLTPLAPYEAEEVDYFAGMGPKERRVAPSYCSPTRRRRVPRQTRTGKSAWLRRPAIWPKRLGPW
jgi:pimeloyl-ACP methyl ester carboxylesterase